jgi:hypothetical protein
MDDRENTGQQQQSNHQANAPLPPTIDAPAPNPNEPHGEDVHNASGQSRPEPEPLRWFHTPDWWMVVLTALLFIASVITLFVFRDQFKEMQTQTGILSTQAKQAAADSAEAAKKVESQLEIAREQTKATQDSAKAIQRQMRVDQRAWLKIEMASMRNNYIEGQPIEIPMRMINTGKTPALNVYAKIMVEVIHNGESPRFLSLSYRDYRPGIVFSIGLMYPGIPESFPATLKRRIAPGNDIPEPVSREMYEELHSGITYWAVHGMATYNDIFGIAHWVKFCGWITDFPSTPGTYTAGKCSEYNKADDN